jgi:uncharacterized protein YjdB
VDVVWSSSDEDVAVVSSTGRLIARAPGTAVIAASADGESDQRQVIVVPAAAEVAVIEVEPATVSLSPGARQQLRAIVMDAEGNVLDDVAVAWESTDPAVVQVSRGGVVSAVGPGSARITAAASGASGSASVRVRAPALPDLTVALETRPQVECADARTCILMAQVTVRNIGPGPALATTLRLTTSNGLGGSGRVPPLEPGGSTIVEVRTNAGGNCYSPDCGLTATVDPAGEVTESDEENNTTTRTFGG